MEIKIALAGNPNCGKTTLFNALTGSNQFVGNWPGVTVEKKEGKLKGHDDVVVTDLPGIYSLSPYTLEEVVARNYLIDERPDAILNIVDGTNLERNLYLTTQLTELGIPVVVAINMMDVVRKNGDKIDIALLSRALGCKVVEISALKSDGIKEAAETAVAAAKGTKTVPTHTFSGVVEHALAHIEEAALHDLPKENQRWYAIKIFERDDKVLEKLNIAPTTLSHIEEDIAAAESELDDDAESIITNERYVYIASILKGIYKKHKAGELTTSDKIDKVVTNRFAALPIFAAIMFLVYYISVTTVGTWATDWANDGVFGDGWHLLGIGNGEYEEALDEYVSDNGIFEAAGAFIAVNEAVNSDIKGLDSLKGAVEDEDFGALEEAVGSYGSQIVTDVFSGETLDAWLESAMEEAPVPDEFGVWVPGVPVLVESGLVAIGCADWLQSLVLDGIVGGVGAVLGFVPQILVLFILLAFLESCGYMARIAFVMDRIFRKFGLSGKSFIPMLIGTGCGIPGVMASRTIENERDRRMTIMTTTFIPCGAKLPIIALVAGALFNDGWWVAPMAYFIGIAAIVVSGIMLKKTKMFAGDPAPFVMELPAYHMPTVSNILRSMWERGWSFIKKAGTIILLSTILIWAGSVFGVVDGQFGFYLDMEGGMSVLDYIGSAIGWIFAPLGFSAPETAVATIMGLVAKEEVVAVLGVLDFAGMTQLAAFSFLVFNLLCAPCFAAIGAIRREMNSAKWTAFAIGYQCVFAYAVSLCIYQLGMLFAGNFGWHILGGIVAIAIIAFVVYMLVKPYSEATKLTIKEADSKKEAVNS
ncbi:MAG: ferrous iron transporter B [Clostridia bacterium]|nr:ferrous iron transporter B [Clostridia bacterium]